jgi:hypothetical protein
MSWKKLKKFFEVLFYLMALLYYANHAKKAIGELYHTKKNNKTEETQLIKTEVNMENTKITKVTFVNIDQSLTIDTTSKTAIKYSNTSRNFLTNPLRFKHIKSPPKGGIFIF